MSWKTFDVSWPVVSGNGAILFPQRLRRMTAAQQGVAQRAVTAVIEINVAPYSLILDAWPGRRPAFLEWRKPRPGQGWARRVAVPGRRRGHEYAQEVTLIGPWLLTALLRTRPRTVFVQEMGLGAVYAVIARALCGCRVVALIEAPQSRMGAAGVAPWRRWLRRVLARGIDAFAANCEVTAAYLVDEVGVPRSRISVGWWLAGFPGGAAPALVRDADSPLNLLYVGQLIERKGVGLLLEAVASADAEIHLDIVGEGPEEAALKAQVSRLQLGGAVGFHGQRPYDEVAAMMRGSDALVLPSRFEYLGRVAVEAMSLGRPAVVAQGSGAAESLVHHGVDGLIVDASDPVAFGRALSDLAEPRYRASLTAGAARAAQSLTPAAAADAILRAIEIAERTHQGARSPSPGAQALQDVEHRGK